MLLPELARTLGVDPDHIAALARSASWHYREFSIPDRHGGRRPIQQPSRELKAVQRALHQLVIRKLPVHEAAYAYVHGRGIREHAAQHAQHHYLLRLDLRHFFHSISSQDVHRYLAAQRAALPDWWQLEDANLFSRIVCWRGRLAMGAVTSPSLSNAMMHGIDTALSHIASAHGACYSRYADDLYFSTSTPDVLFGIPHAVVRVLRKAHVPQHLYLNHDKTLHLSRKQGRHVTGLVLTDHNQVSLGRQRKRAIRAQIHQWPQADYLSRQKLQGLLAYARDIEPEFVSALLRKYGAGRMAQVINPVASADPLAEAGSHQGSTTMKIKEMMHKPVRSCHTGDSLERAAQLMWEGDCGAIPVVDRNARPVGILTDRDIALVAAQQHKPLWDLKASDVTCERPLFTCSTDTEVHDALRLMAEKKVRRLPVTDASGQLQGIVAMSDIVHEITRQAGTGTQASRELQAAVSTFNVITRPSASRSGAAKM